MRRQNGRWLLIKRAASDRHNPGKWECPGGKLEQGEDTSRALENEVMQEAHIYVRPINPLVAIDSYFITAGPYEGHTYLAIFGIAEWVSGKVKLSEEHDGFMWATYDEMLELDLTDEVRRAAIILEGQLQPSED